MKNPLSNLFLKPINFCFYRNKLNSRCEGIHAVESLASGFRTSGIQDVPVPTLVFYDRACPLCRAEMHRLKLLDRHHRLELIDISAEDFDQTKWGVPKSRLSAALHVLVEPERWLVGMPAIRHVYRQVGWGWLMAPTGWPIISPLADIFYRHFAPNRNMISRWLGMRPQAQCKTGYCSSGVISGRPVSKVSRKDEGSSETRRSSVGNERQGGEL